MDPVFPAVLLFGIYIKDLKSAYYRDMATSMFIAAQFTIVKLWNQPRCVGDISQAYLTAITDIMV